MSEEDQLVLLLALGIFFLLLGAGIYFLHNRRIGNLLMMISFACIAYAGSALFLLSQFRS